MLFYQGTAGEANLSIEECVVFFESEEGRTLMEDAELEPFEKGSLIVENGVLTEESIDVLGAKVYDFMSKAKKANKTADGVQKATIALLLVPVGVYIMVAILATIGALQAALVLAFFYSIYGLTLNMIALVGVGTAAFFASKDATKQVKKAERALDDLEKATKDPKRKAEVAAMKEQFYQSIKG